VNRSETISMMQENGSEKRSRMHCFELVTNLKAKETMQWREKVENKELGFQLERQSLKIGQLP
jgi:hypothetical protein